uniref:Major facilitator superfamily (MFS) profile domain-containing protein n=1 Tax=Cuerna arida TaxID=1464854 RepID=A0A1B6GLM4_9HEMI
MVAMLTYMTLGVIGLITIPWTMTAELFSLDIRGMAQGLCISMANILMFSALKIYPFLTEALGGMYAVHWFFAVTSFVTVVFVFLFLPETHKKTLPQIQEYFRYNTIYILRRKDTD